MKQFYNLWACSEEEHCLNCLYYTVKHVYNDHSKIDKTKVLMTNGSLMKVKSIAEYSKGSILQYFLPALSDKWSWKPICGPFETLRFTQVLLYYEVMKIANRSELGMLFYNLGARPG